MPPPQGAVMSSKCRKQCQEIIDRFHQRAGICPVPVSCCGNFDIFDKMRPERGANLEYNISQTDVKLNAGDTRLHLQQTEAEYRPMENPPPPPPPPKPEPKVKYGTGGGPVWEFLHEKFKRQQDELQEVYKKNLEKFIKHKKATGGTQKRTKHQILLQLAGPDWYQELSPQQLQTVDQLKTCIVTDLRNKTIINTQENIASLGLVLRPYHKHVETALLNCCACPVEFLLVLYQLIDPKRTCYSINDRLLLSAVVHLTMRETLRELHIRIPSPPPKKKQKKPKVPKEPKKTYESPYLEPYTFKPTPRKYTGVYEDKHRQYPDIPYFSYIEELKKEPEVKESGDSCSKSYEYGNVDYETGKEDTPKSSKEAVPYKSASKDVDDSENAESKSSFAKEKELEIKNELKEAQKKYNSLTDDDHPPKLRTPSIYIPCNKELTPESSKTKEEDKNEDINMSVQVKVTTQFDENLNPISNKCECTIVLNNNTPTNQPQEDVSQVEKNATEEIESNPIPIEENEVEENQVNENEVEENQVNENEVEENKVNENEVEENQVGDNDVEEVEVAVVEAKKSNKEQEEDDTPCDCEEQEMAKENTETAKKEPPIVRASDIQLPSIKTDREITVKKRIPSECVCKAEVQKFIDTNVCPCDKCTEYRRSNQKSLFIMAGSKLTEDNELLPVIGGVKLAPTCKCLQKYQNEMKKYEMLKLRKQAINDLKSLKQKYIIGGVVMGKDGKPIYIIQCVIPIRECPCVKLRQEQLKEEQRIANMPKPIEGGLRCVIGGVRETPDGNIFEITAVLPKPECRCMKVYNAFDQKHKLCDTLYQRYVEKMQRDMEEYMSEVETNDKYQQEADDLEKAEQEKAIPEKESYPCVCCRESSSSSDLSSDSDESYVELETSLTITLETAAGRKKKQKQLCPGLNSIQGEEPEESSTDTISSYGECSFEECGGKKKKEEIKRFIILEKIPCKWSEQKKILKKSLASLENDGFPLAKLPEAWKLPHFKLWMQLRCGMFWTLKDRWDYLTISKQQWNHTALCQRKPDSKILDFEFSSREGEKYTWRNAQCVKKIVSDKVETFYRRVRQAAVNDGREFFPTTFTYEFPFSSFRDCYFAYTPSKEEDVHCVKPWLLHEYTEVRPHCCL